MVGVELDGEELICEICDAQFTQFMKAVRVRHGSAKYKKWGTDFTPYIGDPVLWFHQRCAVRAGTDLDFLGLDKCFYCDSQFYEIETALELVTGRFTMKPGEPGPIFLEEEVGLIHWACACEYTELPLPIEEEP